MEDKEIAPLLRAIVPMADHVIYTRPVYSRAADPAVLAEKAAQYNKPGQVVPILTKALDRAREMVLARDLILVTGSLYTAGEAISHFDPVQWSPEEV